MKSSKCSKHMIFAPKSMRRKETLINDKQGLEEKKGIKQFTSYMADPNPKVTWKLKYCHVTFKCIDFSLLLSPQAFCAEIGRVLLCLKAQINEVCDIGTESLKEFPTYSNANWNGMGNIQHQGIFFNDHESNLSTSSWSLVNSRAITHNLFSKKLHQGSPSRFPIKIYATIKCI